MANEQHIADLDLKGTERAFLLIPRSEYEQLVTERHATGIASASPDIRGLNQQGIPLEFRTRRMNKAEAARKLGYKDSNPGQYINRLIEKGPDKGGIHKPMGSGQLWIFDLRDFSENVRDSICAKTL